MVKERSVVCTEYERQVSLLLDTYSLVMNIKIERLLTGLMSYQEHN